MNPFGVVACIGIKGVGHAQGGRTLDGLDVSNIHLFKKSFNRADNLLTMHNLAIDAGLRKAGRRGSIPATPAPLFLRKSTVLSASMRLHPRPPPVIGHILRNFQVDSFNPRFET